MRDLKFAFRQLLKNPGFSAVAVLTLALCLGANLTMFAVVDAVLLRPLPFPEAERLVTMFNTYPKAGADRAGSSIANYYERRGVISAFSSLSIFHHDSAVIGEAGATQREEVMRVSPEFFATLGVNPVMGRVFAEEETTPQADDVAILTTAFWRTRFNADPSVLGHKITVDGLPRTVVGVLPANFRFLSSEARLFLPFSSGPEQRSPDRRHWGNGDEIIARLKPGATIREAQVQIDAQNAALEEKTQVIGNTGFRTLVASLRGDHVKSVKPILLLLQAGVLCLLLIGGVNLVNLLLIRASSRTKELAIRQSLGANRRHVASQVMVETVLITFIGGLFGLAVAIGGIRISGMLGLDRLPLGAHVAFDGRLALAALFGSIALGILIGIPIAWFNLHSHLTDALQSESRSGTANRSAQRVRHGFIVGQIALAFVLLAGAGLLGLSLKRAMAVSPGFRPDHILTGHLALPSASYPDGTSRLALTERLIGAIESQPGVAAAGAVTVIPFSGDGHKIANTPVGVSLQGTEPFHTHQTYGVTGDYFAAMGMSLREGRFLNAGDSRRNERVCVVDGNFARRYWPQGGVIGQRVFQGAERGKDEDAFTVVGIVGPVKHAGLTEKDSNGAVYYPYRYRANNDFFVVTRTVVPPETFGLTLRSVLRGIDANLPLDALHTMDVRIADSLLTRRSPALLAGIFASAALLLAAIGTYGVLSFAVAQRRREIGVRIALGARRHNVLGLVVGNGMRLVLVGIVAGLAGTAVVTRIMKSLLFDVTPFDPLTFVSVPLVLSTVGLLACWIPARRAARVDPMEALRSE